MGAEIVSIAVTVAAFGLGFVLGGLRIRSGKRGASQVSLERRDIEALLPELCPADPEVRAVDRRLAYAKLRAIIAEQDRRKQPPAPVLSDEERERLKKAFGLLWTARNKGPAVKAEAIDSAIELLRNLASQEHRGEGQ